MAKAAVSKKPAALKKPARKPKAAAAAPGPADAGVFTVGLNQLRYGHDKGAPVVGLNARVTDRESKGALMELIASISAVGLIAPLAVAASPSGAWYVIDGNRRLAALRQVAKAHGWPDDQQIPVRKVDDSLFEASVAANVVRAPMHPVYQFEAFARMHADGRTVGDIAARFGLADRTVRQRLALGQLHPDIRAAWRAGEIDAETAQAFTLTSDQDRQVAVLKEARGEDQLHQHFVEQRIVGNVRHDSRMVRFVGLDNYRAAGGEIVTDLFDDVVHVVNPEIVDRLAREKLQAACAELVAAGWGWAKSRADANTAVLHWEHVNWHDLLTAEERQRHEEASELPWSERQAAMRELQQIGRLRGFSDEQRAVLGCLVEVDHAGQLSIDYGWRDGRSRTHERATETDTPSEVATKPERMVPADLAQSLSEQLTKAAAAALAADASLALAVATAAMMHRYRGPARVDAGRTAETGSARSFDTFAEAFAAVEGLDDSALLQLLAGIVAGSLDLTVEGTTRGLVKPADIRLLLRILDQDRFHEAALATFDVPAYFAKASSKAAIAALVDIEGRNTCISKKKADIAALAAIRAKEKGWLPHELRGPGYSGPGAEPVAEAAE